MVVRYALEVLSNHGVLLYVRRAALYRYTPICPEVISVENDLPLPCDSSVILTVLNSM